MEDGADEAHQDGFDDAAADVYDELLDEEDMKHLLEQVPILMGDVPSKPSLDVWRDILTATVFNHTKESPMRTSIPSASLKLGRQFFKLLAKRVTVLSGAHNRAELAELKHQIDVKLLRSVVALLLRFRRGWLRPIDEGKHPHIDNGGVTRTLNALNGDAVAADCFDDAGDYQHPDRAPG